MKFQSRWRRFLTEGGNVFKGESVDSIPLAFIEPTLNEYYEELSRLFPQHSSKFTDFTPLGSVGKKAKSGDIDLAVDVEELFPQSKVTDEVLQSWNLNPADWKATYEKMVKRARTAKPSEVELRAFLYEIARYIGENSQIIKTDLKKVRPGQMFSLFPQISDSGEQKDVGVQIDWMMGNKNWLKFSYFSPAPTESQPLLKGLHRTQLLLAMFLAKDHSFKHVGGVFDRKTGEKVAHSPAEAMRLLGKLYGTNVSPEVFNTFEGALEWLMGNVSEQDKNRALDVYLTILDRTKGNKEALPSGEKNRCGYIPQELEDYWVQNWQRLGLKGDILCKTMNDKLRAAVEGGMLQEAATPRIANLGNSDIIALIDLILGEESVLDASEKLAGQNLSVIIDRGQVYTKYKTQPDFIEAREPFKSIFAAHDGDGEYTFEMISPEDRPDYVNYLTDSTIFVDFTGRLTDEMAKKLSNDQYTFMTKKQIRRNQFDVTPEQRQELAGLRSRAEQRLRKRDKQEIADRIKAIILSPNVQSVLGGGMEGLYVTGGDKNFKIPSPTYQELQKLQVGIYAVLSGRTKIPKKVARQRVIDGGDDDKIVQDLRKFLSFAQNDIPAGYRMFVSPEEAMNLLSKMDTPEGRKQVYVFLNKRIKKKGEWYTPEQLQEAINWLRRYKTGIF
tara:strand:- start:1270 stop:3279 length:2010 start_codon:yes stop_codon:yes gene_type:complete